MAQFTPIEHISTSCSQKRISPLKIRHTISSLK